MSHEVVIKSNHYGIRLILDKQIPFSDLLDKVAQKFREMGDFFKDAKMAVAFEERKLTQEEMLQLVDTITQNSRLQIVSIIDDDQRITEKMKQQVAAVLETATHKMTAQEIIPQSAQTPVGTDFYRGNLRSGQILESESSITLIGDVNPGAKIVSGGNIVILGSLKGNAHAGAFGDQECFIVALDMNPIQLQIGELIAKSPDKEREKKRSRKMEMNIWKKEKEQENRMDAQIVLVQEGYICMEPLTKENLSHL